MKFTPYRKAVRARDQRARELGHVPRPINPPVSTAGSIDSLRCLSYGQAHAALLKRIKG